MVKLILKEDGHRRERNFDQNQITIGRSNQNDLVLKDPKTSRFHCRLVVEADACKLIDTGSQNGTKLNGDQVLRHPLQPGDMVKLLPMVGGG